MLNKTFIYAIQEDKASWKAPVKIGLARNVDARCTNLQVGNPRKLVVRLTIGPISPEHAASLEKQLHRSFKEHWLRGEWFSGKILSRFKRLNLPCLNYPAKGEVMLVNRGHG